jgi:hypothetical protein
MKKSMALGEGYTASGFVVCLNLNSQMLLEQQAGDGVCLQTAPCRESAVFTVFFDQLLRE